MDTSIAQVLFSSSLSDISGLLFVFVGLVLSISIALLGLGFGWTRLKSHVIGFDMETANKLSNWYGAMGSVARRNAHNRGQDYNI